MRTAWVLTACVFSDRVGRQPHERWDTCSAWCAPREANGFALTPSQSCDGMPDVLPSCVVVFVPCRVCLLWRHRTVCSKMPVPDVCLPFSYLSFLTVRSHGRCSFSPRTHGKKGWVVCTQGIVLERCLTFWSFVSYTTTETKGLFAPCLVCSSVEMTRWKDEELDRWIGEMLRYLNG